MEKKILCVIPARGGSQGLTNKNTKLLDGRPLISYVIKTALESSLIDKVIVSTDSDDIAAIARQSGAEVPFLRPKELAQDSTTLFPVLIHAMKILDGRDWRADVIISFQPTSPLTTLESLDSGVRKILEGGCDSVSSVCEIEKNHPCRALKLEGDRVYPLTEYTTEEFPNRQDRPQAFAHNGAFYIRTRQVLENWEGSGWALGEKQCAVVMKPVHSVNIDSILDFKLAEIILRENIG